MNEWDVSLFVFYSPLVFLISNSCLISTKKIRIYLSVFPSFISVFLFIFRSCLSIDLSIRYIYPLPLSIYMCFIYLSIISINLYINHIYLLYHSIYQLYLSIYIYQYIYLSYLSLVASHITSVVTLSIPDSGNLLT